MHGRVCAQTSLRPHRLPADDSVPCRQRLPMQQFVFDLYDADGNGFISYHEVFKYLVTEVLGESMSVADSKLHGEHMFEVHACVC